MLRWLARRLGAESGAPQPLVCARFVEHAQTVVALGPELGAGRFGVVRQATHVEHGAVAVKVVPKRANQHELRNELQCLERVRGRRNCMQLLDAFEDHASVYLVTPLYAGGELFDEIVSRRTFTERDAALVMRDILTAIAGCHANSVVHRDIKPENLLYTAADHDSPLVLVDFGMSRTFREGDEMYMQCGSPSYVAPEVLARNYTEKCDEWSAGIILHILFTGGTPFGPGSDDEILSRVEAFQESQLWDDEMLASPTLSPEARDLLSKLLCRDPARRISAQDALEHAWITDTAHGRAHIVLADAFANMREFNRHHQLKKATIRVIAELARARDDAKAREFARLLETLKRDEAGRVKLTEVAALVAADGQVPAHLVSKAGTVDPHELIASALSESVYLDEQYLLAAFQRFDTDSNGVIDRKELARAMRGDGSADKSAIVDEAMKLVDTDGSGDISFEEFARAIRETTRMTGVDAVVTKRELTLLTGKR